LGAAGREGAGNMGEKKMNESKCFCSRIKRACSWMIIMAMLLPALLLCACSKSERLSRRSGGKLVLGEAFEDYLENGPKPTDPNGDQFKKVAISLPTKNLRRWIDDGNRMKASLEKAGYEVDLQYAANDTSTQIDQVRNMILGRCSLLIIAPISSAEWHQLLSEAKRNNIPVIAYDRLIMDTDAVDYYVTFDNYVTGQMQAEYIIEKLDVEHSNRPVNIEIFTGDATDNHTNFFYSGAMDVLKPYIDAGNIVVKSGQTELDQVATVGWRTELAQNRMDALLASFYSDGTPLDAVLCSNDSTALGVTNSLVANYTGSYPVITGLDCDIVNVKNIIAGKQSMSIFYDTRIMADATVNMALDLLSGKEPTTNDDVRYNNGSKNVRSYLCAPLLVDISNYKDILIGGGYYTEQDLS
jgi:putative multiple sugar transport system substrate-binding protein